MKGTIERLIDHQIQTSKQSTTETILLRVLVALMKDLGIKKLTMPLVDVFAPQLVFVNGNANMEDQTYTVELEDVLRPEEGAS